MLPNYDVDMQLDVKVPMRDGINLSADIYLPRAHGTFPTVLMRTPYSNNADGMVEKARRLANNGYACVLQDCRGRWDSEGTYYAFREGEDGYDTQEWIGNREWCSGRIGMAGSSYGGAVQWRSAPYGSRFLKCMTPRVICADYYTGLVHPGGAFQLNVMLTWGMRTNARTGQTIEFHNWTEAFRALPVNKMDENAGRDVDFWKDWVEHDAYDDYWEEFNDETRWADMIAPAFNMGGWYDLYAAQTFSNYNGLRHNGGSEEAKKSKLIVGPWPHALSASPKTGDVDFGAPSMVDLESLEQRWFDYWLKGIDNGVVDEPPLSLFIMGVNRWRDENEWPLARTRWEKWHLHSAGRANTLLGDGCLSHGSAGRGTPRSLHLRSAIPGADHGRKQLLLTPYRPLGSAGPAPGGNAERRALLYQRPNGNRPGSHRSRQGRPLRRDRLHGHGLDRQAGGRVTIGVRHEPLRRHPEGSFSRGLYPPVCCSNPATCTPVKSTWVSRETSSRRAIVSASKSRRRTSPGSTVI